MSEFPEVLTLEQAAAFLQISSRTVQRLVRDGQMPGRQIGSQWRFEREQLRQWVRGEFGPEDTVKAQTELSERERKRFGTDAPETLIELQQQAVRRLAESLDKTGED